MIQGKNIGWSYLALGGQNGLAELLKIITSTAQSDTGIGIDGTQINVGSRRLFLKSELGSLWVEKSYLSVVFFKQFLSALGSNSVNDQTTGQVW